MDRLSKERRSWNMSHIRSKDTKPEVLVRSLLHRMGYRFRLHTNLPGHPDIVLPRYKSVIFVHGCFWHRHEECKYAYMPKTRMKFWESKFKSNVNRDRTVVADLKRLGWHVLIIWECQVRDEKGIEHLLWAFLGRRCKYMATQSKREKS